jgi:glycosyltransferase involved in cell wall biosynthesis
MTDCRAQACREPPVIANQRVVLVLPAYNAARTLRRTIAEVPLEVVDHVILVDDASHDETVSIARELGLSTHVHAANRGYGANQKTCYRLALEAGADIVVMLHPDYQYSPRLVQALTAMVASGHFDIALGSRIISRGALAGGMPLWKYVSNRLLTLIENVLLGQKLSEYHTGFRAFSRRVLETLPYQENSDDFVFDNQILVQAVYWGYSIGEISCPARYFAEASSINFRRSLRYGCGVLLTAIAYRLQRWRLASFRLFREPANNQARSASE